MYRQSLRIRIYTGFAVMAFALVLMGSVSYIGQQRLMRDYDIIRNVENVRGDVLHIDRDVQELRLRVNRYVEYGHDSTRDEFQKIQHRINQRLDQINDADVDVHMSELFAQIRIHITAFADQFQSVVEERQLRQTLYEERLPSKVALVEQAFAKILASIGSMGGDETTALSIAHSLSAFSKGEKALLRYFDDPDTGVVNTSMNLLSQCRDGIDDLRINPNQKDELLAAIDEFERAGLRAVQATRSYLFFLNVVMAGEASEIAYYSRLLRTYADQQRDSISEHVNFTSRTTSRITSIISALAVFLALLIALRLAVSIVPPIEQLADTFQQLSAGESLSDVPGLSRTDEIGRMSRAAEIFSSQNQTTRKLLTESKQLSAELQRKAEQLEASNHELDSFAYVASHDLKSPLRGIRQLATWIEEDSGDKLSDESRKHLILLTTRISRMEGLLQDLLDYSRAGRSMSDPEDVNVSQIVEEIVGITNNPENVRVTWPENLPLMKTIRIPLHQVLLNLIGNAIKYNHRGSEGLISIEVTPENKLYRFTVRDNGPGIAPENHERVFQMYQRVGNRDVEGTGMGLAIVRKQVENMGGGIQLESQTGAGATFKFTWPVDVKTDAL